VDDPVGGEADRGGDRPLETGWLADTPVGDTVLRRFQHNQADVNAAVATAAGGRTDRTPDVALADTGGPVPYLNQALLMRPLAAADDPVVEVVERFAGRSHLTMLSAWPTPDLRGRGWVLVGHPAFVVRNPAPPRTVVAPGVEVRTVATAEELAVAEQVAIEGYPMHEAAGLPPGAVLSPALLSSPVTYRTGRLEGTPVAAAASHVGHGVVNLCLAATLPAARRRGVWESLVWARVGDAADLPAVAFTSDDSRPGFERMGFLPILRFTLWYRPGG
jgi:hypothetical protein